MEPTILCENDSKRRFLEGRTLARYIRFVPISGFTDFKNQNMYWMGGKKEKSILHSRASLHKI